MKTSFSYILIVTFTRLISSDEKRLLSDNDQLVTALYSPSSLTSILSGVTSTSLHSPASNHNLDPFVDQFDPPSGLGRCEEITIPMCHGIGYNYTAMPNELNHDTQEEAGLEVHQFWPLVEIKCSIDLKFFLCSMYAPICLPEYTKPLPACRSVCERARIGCAPLMQQYGFSWPERMSCERLPSQGDPEYLCMEQDNQTFPSTENSSSNTLRPVLPSKPSKPSKVIQTSKCKGGRSHKNCSYADQDEFRNCTCSCNPPLLHSSPSVYKSRDNDDHNTPKFPSLTDFMLTQKFNIMGVTCVLPCRGLFLSDEEQNFATLWLTLWSGLCAISTLATVTTFLIDTDRFKYPERPIVFLSACYFMVSLGYLSRSILGHEKIACDGDALRHGTLGSKACVTVFLLIYFFGMASSVWWVILSFTWFLAAGLKWGNEAIASYAQYFHLAAWISPTGQTVWALISGNIAGDPIAGVCTVASENIQMFISTPLLIYLLLGTTFLLAGFVSLFRIRSVIKRQAGAKADKLEKLMIRIGIFSVLYTVPASTVLACHLYETSLRNEWLFSLACPCKQSIKPLYSVLMLKYFMALAVGITSGVWIWSGKTVDSWHRLWVRLFNKYPDTRANITNTIVTDSTRNIYSSKHAARSVIQYPAHPVTVSTPFQQNSISSTSQHHMHHQVLKQPPISHV
ncbi:hypothetical protein QAD02_021038 [Eretmocerus hayati]|uniref:Uncharacterized protein n=1 Tax=Eretmocerus hayati TaxID=131215 RepID=A0ACC2PTX4_9HYME|nr:hypothetical protein QAD02_021038 [Eretmocerus hayati]